LNTLTQTSPPQLSPNGESYWNGSAWVSLLSADGTQLWDGKKWLPRIHPAVEVAPAEAALAQPVASDRPSWLAAGVSMPDSVSSDTPVVVGVVSTAAAAPVAPPPGVGPSYVAPMPAGGQRIKMAWIIGGAIAAVAALPLGVFVAIQVFHPYAYLKVTGANSVADFAAEQNYDATYSRDAAKIQADSIPYAPTSTTPGVCNKGGTKQGCYDTDQKAMGDFRLMMRDLGQLAVPPRFKQADTDLRAGLQLSIDGLSLRDQAIASTDPSASFTASNQKLQEALTMLHQANNEFPADNAPQPKF
jgi:hypothetical protein